MEAPARYRYDPRWEILACYWIAFAGLLIVVLAVPFPRALSVPATFFIAGLGALLTLRRYAFPRSLVLDQEGAWLPGGFMRMHVRRVVFAETIDFWEAFLPFNMPVLCLRCRGKTHEVNSTLLADGETYQAVAEYICSRVVAAHA